MGAPMCVGTAIVNSVCTHCQQTLSTDLETYKK